MFLTLLVFKSATTVLCVLLLKMHYDLLYIVVRIIIVKAYKTHQQSILVNAVTKCRTVQGKVQMRTWCTEFIGSTEAKVTP